MDHTTYSSNEKHTICKIWRSKSQFVTNTSTNSKKKEKNWNSGRIGTVLKVEAVVGEGGDHLHVIKRLALGEVVGVGGGEEAGAVAVVDGPRAPAVDVEGRRIVPAHLSVEAGAAQAISGEIPAAAAERSGEEGGARKVTAVGRIPFGWIGG